MRGGFASPNENVVGISKRATKVKSVGIFNVRLTTYRSHKDSRTQHDSIVRERCSTKYELIQQAFPIPKVIGVCKFAGPHMYGAVGEYDRVAFGYGSEEEQL